jgi:hypothetical protein
MGYRDDFYKKDNILGYTGELLDNPSVYFADAGGTSPRLVNVGGKDQVLVSFGHITQHHSMADNIGRGAVLESHSYSIYNNSQGAAEECVHGPRECERIFGEKGRKEMESYGEEGVTKDGHYIFHPSRNKFIPVNKGTIDILAKAIDKFPQVKKREA